MDRNNPNKEDPDIYNGTSAGVKEGGNEIDSQPSLAL